MSDAAGVRITDRALTSVFTHVLVTDETLSPGSRAPLRMPAADLGQNLLAAGPIANEIDDLRTQIEGAVVAGMATFTTKALMVASALGNDSWAQVLTDATDAFNGIYRKESGTWVLKVSISLPAFSTRLTTLENHPAIVFLSINVGSTTANAIVAATEQLGTVYRADALYMVRPTLTNTAVKPTLAINGEAAKEIWEIGANVAAPAGRLRLGIAYLLRYNPNFGGLFEIVSPSSSEIKIMQALNRADDAAETATQALAIARRALALASA